MKTKTDWKHKYYNQLDELEKLEKDWRSKETMLYKGLARLTYAIPETDINILNMVNNLRHEIQTSNDINLISNTIESILEFLNRKEHNNDPDKVYFETGRALAVKILSLIKSPKPSQNQCNELIKKFNKIKTKQEYEKLEDKTVDLANLIFQQQILPKASNNSFSLKEKISSIVGINKSHPQVNTSLISDVPDLVKHLFSELIENLQVDKSNTYIINSLMRRLQHVVSVDDINNLVVELTKTLNEQLSGEESSNQAHALCGGISKTFLEFIESLIVPPQLQDQAEAIRHKLTNNIDQSEIDQTIKELVNLVTRMRTEVLEEKEDLENFLVQLNERLQELDLHLNSAYTRSKASLSNGYHLDKDMDTKVNDIKQSVRGATDMEQLKSYLQERLEAIQSQIKHYRQDEKHRQESLEQELSELKNRLLTVESETNKLRQRLKEKHKLALIDPTTNIFNRLAFEERIKKDYTHFKRYQSPLTLIILDIDHFKNINDSFGHKAGDLALRYIAEVLQDNLRESDFLARYGGEEFIVIVPEATEESVSNVAEKLRNAIEKSDFHFGEKSVPITLSCGISSFKQNDTPEEVFERADQALYLSKQQGRNQCNYT